MLELSITNYQMRRPPMAANVRALSDMPARMTVHDTGNEYVKKMMITAYALEKQNQVVVEKDPSGTNINLSREFKGSVGTLYLRENRKLHFEIDSNYVEEIEIKAFFSKKIEKRHHVACVTGIVSFTFDDLIEVRIAGNRITFTYTLLPDGKGQPVAFAFEMPEVRSFARDLYDWAERKGFKLMKAVDEDFQQPVIDHSPAPAPPPEGTLYSVMIDPVNVTIEYGQSLQYTGKPVDVKGNVVPETSVKWSVDPASIGTITQNGLFNPTTDNVRATIIATASSATGTTSGFATITIIPKTTAHHGPTMESAPASEQGTTTTPTSLASPPPDAAGKVCPTCNGPLNLSPTYNRWFCPKCQKWV